MSAPVRALAASTAALALVCGLAGCSGGDDAEPRTLATTLPTVQDATRLWEASGTTADDGGAERPGADVEVGEGVTGLVLQFDCTGTGTVSVRVADVGAGDGDCPTTDGRPARVELDGEVPAGTHRASVRTRGDVDWIATVEARER